MINTSEYQVKMTGAQSAGGMPVTGETELSQMRKLWRITTEARPVAFDPARMMFAHEYTVYIMDYDIGIFESDNPVNESLSSIELSRRRIATYIDKNIIKKRYDYIFTGLNSQVLNLDLTVNTAFASIVARLSGAYSNAASTDNGMVYQNNPELETSFVSSITRVIGLQNNAATANTASTNALIAEVTAAIKSSKLSTYVKTRYQNILNSSAPDKRIEYLNSFANKLPSAKIAEPVRGFEGTFVSDVNYNSDASKKAYNNFIESTKGNLRPIAKVEGMQDYSSGAGVEANSNAGIQKAASMFSTALHGGGGNSTLQVLKILIKGDPYWLCNRPITSTNHQLFNSKKTKSEAFAYLLNNQFQTYDAVNIYGSDNFLVLRFRSPRIVNESANGESSITPFDEIETFSGVYKITVITNKFEGGKFTQELEAVIDPTIRLTDFSNALEIATAKFDKAITVENLSPDKSIPNLMVEKVLPTKAARIIRATGIQE